MEPSEELIDHMMEEIKAMLLTSKTKAEYSGESIKLHKVPKRPKLSETRVPTGSTPPTLSIILGELNATTTYNEAITRDTTGNKTAPSLTGKNTATTDATKPTKVKPFQPHKKPELRID